MSLQHDSLISIPSPITLRELLINTYLWADAHAWALLLASLAWGLGGTLLAHFGKGGLSDQDGRLIASVVIGGAVLLLVAAEIRRSELTATR